MRENTVLLNVMVITIIVIVAVLAFVIFLAPKILNQVNDGIGSASGLCEFYNADGKCTD